MGMSLVVENLCFSYPGQDRRLLHDVSFSVADGESLCLLGPNGSGKTTLLGCLLGMNRADSGSIQVNGNEVSRISRRLVARQIAYVPQSSTVMFPFSVFDMVAMGRTPHLSGISVPSAADGRVTRSALDRLGIAHLADRPFSEISGGERQLVLIARALCQEARIFIMDEPAANLDYGNQVRLLRIVKDLSQAGYSIVMSAHNPDHAFHSATHAAVLRDGRIIALGNPHDVVTSQRLSDLYSARISVLTATIPEDPAREVKVCIPLM
jgi:iron complex transport system ATP-binding protein